MRQLSDGERELWNEMQREAAGDPADWKTLSERVGVRRKGPVPCDICQEIIEVGERYTTVSALEDGEFVQFRAHNPHCPKIQAALSEGDPPWWADAGSNMAGGTP